MNKKIAFILVIVFSFLSFTTPLIIYLIHFNNGFSSLNEDWGNFGSFYGGIISSVFSFISFLALLYTIYIQQTEIGITKKEIEDNKVLLEQDNMRKDLLNTLEKIEIKLEDRKNYYDKFIDNLTKTNNDSYPDFKEIISLMKLMKAKCNELSVLQKDTNLIEYYGIRFNYMANGLFKLGYLSFTQIEGD